MNCAEFENRIDAFVDGELDETARLDVERHLEGCDACRAAVEELRGLLREAGALPRAIEPPRDLFSAVRSAASRRVAPGSAPGAGSPGRAWLGWAGLAASLLILLAAAALFLGPWEVRAPATAEGVLPAASFATSRYLAAEDEYLRATEQLLAALEERRAELPPETAAVVERNLQIIDAAIADVKKALDADPGDARNGEFLTVLHRQKIQLLWRASRLSS